MCSSKRCCNWTSLLVLFLSSRAFSCHSTCIKSTRTENHVKPAQVAGKTKKTANLNCRWSPINYEVTTTNTSTTSPRVGTRLACVWRDWRRWKIAAKDEDSSAHYEWYCKGRECGIEEPTIATKKGNLGVDDLCVFILCSCTLCFVDENTHSFPVVVDFGGVLLWKLKRYSSYEFGVIETRTGLDKVRHSPNAIWRRTLHVPTKMDIQSIITNCTRCAGWHLQCKIIYLSTKHRPITYRSYWDKNFTV